MVAVFVQLFPEGRCQGGRRDEPFRMLSKENAIELYSHSAFAGILFL